MLHYSACRKGREEAFPGFLFLQPFPARASLVQFGIAPKDALFVEGNTPWACKVRSDPRPFCDGTMQGRHPWSLLQGTLRGFGKCVGQALHSLKERQVDIGERPADEMRRSGRVAGEDGF